MPRIYAPFKAHFIVVWSSRLAHAHPASVSWRALCLILRVTRDGSKERQRPGSLARCTLSMEYTFYVVMPITAGHLHRRAPRHPVVVQARGRV